MLARTTARPARDDRRRAYTLVEVMVVATILGILAVMPIPRLARAIEQSKLDVAASNLRAIWSAERFYYLENGRYGTLAELAPASDSSGAGLIDPSIASGVTYYGYTVDVGDGQSFTATASHPTGGPCSGTLTIDQTGTLACQVAYAAPSGPAPMTPSLEPR